MSGLWMLRKHFVLPEALPRRPQITSPSTKIHPAMNQPLGFWLLWRSQAQVAVVGASVGRERAPCMIHQSPALDFTKQTNPLSNKPSKSIRPSSFHLHSSFYTIPLKIGNAHAVMSIASIACPGPQCLRCQHQAVLELGDLQSHSQPHKDIEMISGWSYIFPSHRNSAGFAHFSFTWKMKKPSWGRFEPSKSRGKLLGIQP